MAFTSDFLEAFDALGLSAESFEGQSRSPFSPVFVGDCGGQRVVLKQTRAPIQSAHAIHRWTRRLSTSQLLVVTPIAHIQPNPVQVGDKVWVVYPFIEGSPYSPTEIQTRAAGRLLGAIHSVPQTEDPDAPSFHWPEQTPQSIGKDVAALANLVREQQLPSGATLIRRYKRSLEMLSAEYMEPLKEANLPRCMGPWDYKANNLIFTGSSSPWLIDPDSAGKLPRILDLALAAILFHNELDSAPRRLFTAIEWDWFCSGYTEQVSLTDSERRCWPIALEFMRLEEGLWLVLNDEQGWEDERRQRDFLLDLLTSSLRQLSRLPPPYGPPEQD